MNEKLLLEMLKDIKKDIRELRTDIGQIQKRDWTRVGAMQVITAVVTFVVTYFFGR